jgi:hypothetical protein
MAVTVKSNASAIGKIPIGKAPPILFTSVTGSKGKAARPCRKNPGGGAVACESYLTHPEIRPC